MKFMENFGYVYLLENDDMPNLYKIGMTSESPEKRAKQLSCHTGVPAPFKVISCYHCLDPLIAEKSIHKFLHGSRHLKEFFYFSDDSEAFEGFYLGMKYYLQSIGC